MRRCRNILIGVLAGLLATGGPPESRGCTDFRIRAADGTMVVGRTMDFGLSLLSRIRTYTRGEHWTSKAPGGSPGIEWTSRCGFVGINVGGRVAEVFGISDNLADGMNEAGLAFAWLSLPDFTTYQDEAAAREPERALGHWNLCLGIMGDFATVAEVRDAPAGNLLGVVTIPPELERLSDDGPGGSDHSRWAVIKNLGKRVYNFKGYAGHTFRAVRIGQPDLNPGARRRSIPAETGDGFVDVTRDLRNQPQAVLPRSLRLGSSND